ncbi:MAG TPA: ORF6N domain-containing protein [Bryobacteraceae bacterium]
MTFKPFITGSIDPPKQISYIGKMRKANVKSTKKIVSSEPVDTLIHLIRGQKVMLDSDLARLYDVETKRLNEAVARNQGRFPPRFAFQLTQEEANVMRSQIATASKRNLRYQPVVFTEHGVVMLSSVLNSPRAIRMGIIVVEAFVRLRELIATNKDIANRVEKLERSHDRTASVIEVLVEDIDRPWTEGRTAQRPVALQ